MVPARTQQVVSLSSGGGWWLWTVRTVLLPLQSSPRKTALVFPLPLTAVPSPSPFLAGLFWTAPVHTNSHRVGWEPGDSVLLKFCYSQVQWGAPLGLSFL